MTNFDGAVAHACERVPGMVRGALLYLPDGFLLAATRQAALLDLEPLIRSAARCLSTHATLAISDRALAPFAEYMFVIHDQIVVVERGRREQRIALVVASTREHNVGFVVAATRLALAELEGAIDLRVWGF